MIEASCHCGAARFEVARATDTVTDCNCSICRRLGVLWAYYEPTEVTPTTPGDTLASYIWGDEDIAFHHCRVCGCITHWSPLRETAPKRMGFNARLFAPEVLAAASVRHFDGAAA